MSRDWAADAAAALNAGHEMPEVPADLDRARWLLMSAKAEASDAIYRAGEARRAAAWAIGAALLSLSSIPAVLLLAVNA